jgi:hypothetical protein
MAIRQTLDVMKAKVPQNTIICGDNQEILRTFKTKSFTLHRKQKMNKG